PDPRFKRFAGHLADLQAETAQDSPNAQFHIQQLSEKLLARDQQRSDLLRSNRFGVHLLEPSHPQQLGCGPSSRSSPTIPPSRAASPAERLQMPLASDKNAVPRAGRL